MTRMPGSGIHSVTVPGAVAGWDALRPRFGTRPMSELLAPAIFYASNGFPVTDVSRAAWADLVPKLSADPNAAKTFLPNGRPPAAGEIFTNPDSPHRSGSLPNGGSAGFYEGKTAEAILAISREKGGTMTGADLKEYAPEWVDPISTTYRGWTVYELPPNTQGIAALMMLNLMEARPLGEYGFHSAKALHVMIEAKKLAYADMLRYVADPMFYKSPVRPMLSKSARGRAREAHQPGARCVQRRPVHVRRR